VLGLAAPLLAVRVGSHRTVVLALLALIGGQLLRSVVPGTAALFLESLVALAGIAVSRTASRR
jgi:CP family cyanate transporter-like MFS transporter